MERNGRLAIWTQSLPSFRQLDVEFATRQRPIAVDSAQPIVLESVGPTTREENGMAEKKKFHFIKPKGV